MLAATLGASLFTDFMLKGKSLLEYTNLFSPNEYEKNDRIILKCFKYILKRLKWKKSLVLLREIKKKLRTLKYHTFWKNISFFLLLAVSVAVKMKKYLKKKNQWKC